MANKVFRGDAQDVAQVQTITIGSATNGQTFTVTINQKETTYTAGSSETTTTVAAALQLLLAAVTEPEYIEVTFTQSVNVITATGSEAGVPFTLTVGGTGTISTTVTTAAKGKNFWSDPDNWLPNGVPANGDDVFIDESPTDIRYGIDQSSVTLASLTISGRRRGDIGLPVWTGEYYEYRETRLRIGATTVSIGDGDGQGLARCRLDFGSVANALTVFKTAQPRGDGESVVDVIGSNASNTLTVFAGSVGVAEGPGLTARYDTVRVGSNTSPATDARIRFGSGTTLSTLTLNGGDVEVQSAAGTVVCRNGSLIVQGSGTVTSLSLENAVCRHEGTGTVTTLTIRAGATFTRQSEARSVTVTNCTVYSGGTLLDDSKTVTFTNGVVLPDGVAGEQTPVGARLALGRNITLTRA